MAKTFSRRQPTLCWMVRTLTRYQRPPGFDRLQDIVRDTVHNNSSEEEKDEARMAYAAVARELSCPAAALVAVALCRNRSAIHGRER